MVERPSWEYWQVEIQEAPDRPNVMKQAFAEATRYGYELVSVTPIVASTWDEQVFAIAGAFQGWRVRTMSYVLTFKRPMAAP